MISQTVFSPNNTSLLVTFCMHDWFVFAFLARLFIHHSTKVKFWQWNERMSSLYVVLSMFVILSSLLYWGTLTLGLSPVFRECPSFRSVNFTTFKNGYILQHSTTIASIHTHMLNSKTTQISLNCIISNT